MMFSSVGKRDAPSPRVPFFPQPKAPYSCSETFSQREGVLFSREEKQLSKILQGRVAYTCKHRASAPTGEKVQDFARRQSNRIPTTFQAK